MAPGRLLCSGAVKTMASGVVFMSSSCLQGEYSSRPAHCFPLTTGRRGKTRPTPACLTKSSTSERHVQSFHQNVYDLAQLLKTNVSQSN